MLPRRRLEPLTHWLRVRRANHCATKGATYLIAAEKNGQWKWQCFVAPTQYWTLYPVRIVIKWMLAGKRPNQLRHGGGIILPFPIKRNKMNVVSLRQLLESPDHKAGASNCFSDWLRCPDRTLQILLSLRLVVALRHTAQLRAYLQ